MPNILITGATGNTGREVLRYLRKYDTASVIVGVRQVDKAKEKLYDYSADEFRALDLESPQTFSQALKDIDRIFLLRPPHISGVDTYITPFLQAAREQKVQDVVFLSVQGAERSKVIPHNKIEQKIRESGFRYIFLRPSYFKPEYYPAA